MHDSIFIALPYRPRTPPKTMSSFPMMAAECPDREEGAFPEMAGGYRRSITAHTTDTIRIKEREYRRVSHVSTARGHVSVVARQHCLQHDKIPC